MPPLTIYDTEDQIAAFMKDELASVIMELPVAEGDPAWTETSPPGQYQGAVDRVLDEMDAESVATAAPARRVRVLARYFAWDAVVRHMVTFTTWAADGASYSDHQMYEHAVQQLERTRVAAKPWMRERYERVLPYTSGSLPIEIYP